MALDLRQINGIAQDVAREVDDRLSIAGVAATEGGGNRVELLVTVEGCHREPCRHLLNITRSQPGAFEHEFRSKLLSVLKAHDAPTPAR